MFQITPDGACSSVSFIRVNQERWDWRQEYFTLLQLKEAQGNNLLSVSNQPLNLATFQHSDFVLNFAGSCSFLNCVHLTILDQKNPDLRIFENWPEIWKLDPN